MRRSVLVAVVAAIAWVSGAGLSPVAGQVNECAQHSVDGFCIEWAAGGGVGERPTGGSGVPVEVACYWEVVPVPDILGLAAPPPGVPVVWQAWVCPGADPGPAGGAATPVPIRWVVADVVTPEELATAAYARVAGRLPVPEVVSSPPEGVASIVGVPTFVWVANWAGDVTESECGAGLCVTVVATPELSFSPGEPGAGAIECSGGGSRHRAGADPWAEAQRPGACAHAYGLRTGVAGRPEAWPGEVVVRWTIGWTASSGGSGSLPAVSRTEALPRPVNEVQSVVVGEQSR